MEPAGYWDTDPIEEPVEPTVGDVDAEDVADANASQASRVVHNDAPEEKIPVSQIYRPPIFSTPVSKWALLPHRGPPHVVPSLVSLCVSRLAEKMDIAGPRLSEMPLTIVEGLLSTILQRGQLTPANAHWFYKCGHPTIEQFMRDKVSMFRGIPAPSKPNCHD